MTNLFLYKNFANQFPDSCTGQYEFLLYFVQYRIVSVHALPEISNLPIFGIFKKRVFHSFSLYLNRLCGVLCVLQFKTCYT
jgi:hypothetical protein